MSIPKNIVNFVGLIRLICSMTLSQQPIIEKADFGLIKLPEAVDERGCLCVVDPKSSGFPFDIKRVFWIYGVPSGRTRGEHAHHTCAEVLVPLCGHFTAHVTDGRHSADFVMDNRAEGLYIPPMAWCSFTDFSDDCVCLCLASHPYDKEGYINTLEEFLNAAVE